MSTPTPPTRAATAAPATEPTEGPSLASEELDALLRAALEEDLDGGVDVTSVATIPDGERARGDFVARGDGVVAGLAVSERVLQVCVDGVGGGSGAVETVRRVQDGDRVYRGDVLLSVHGPTTVLLTAERTALNLLCHLSGVATETRRWADALQGTGARVRDTRKTTPFLRRLEKYAVRVGGGVNHRMSLSDEALVKDNHVAAAGGVTSAFRQVRERFPGVPVQVEVTSLAQVEEALAAGADSLLLDNMPTAQMRAAVQMVAGRATVEASGGLTLDRAREVAETGVDFLAVGALTHSAPILDIAFDLRLGARA